MVFTVFFPVVSINNVTINGKSFTWTLISRRTVHRAGTRMFKRGLDNEGNAGNFVETEQIVEYENSRCSLVQIRGSIPLVWTQLPNLRYKPPPKLTPGVNQMEAFKKHIDQLIDYGKISIISLINHTGQELILEKALTSIVTNFNEPFLKYESFDFHHECSRMRWDRLSILMKRIENDLSEYGYFFLSADKSTINLQEGIFRTNCIDSLDRTNVVQKLIATLSLENQLKQLYILHSGDKLEDHPNFEFLFRNGN